MKKKQPVYKALNTVPVLFTDQSEYSPEIFDITDYPSRLTAGKNILRFRGNLANLAQNAPLDIEILDYNGEPIYHEVTNYIAEDKSRVVVIYIYPDTSPGPATITLLSEVQFVNGSQVPTEWMGVYNVRWSRTVYVNPTLTNESEIIFDTLPTVDIEEQVGVQLNRNYVVSQFPTYSTGTVKYVSLNNTPTLIIEGGVFNSSMVGGTVTVNTPIDPTPEPRFAVPTIPYSSTIKKVLNTSSILLDTEYIVAASQSIFPHTYTRFNNSAYQISYEETPTYTETQNSESYAIIKINNLQPLTGDISRIKTYINNTGTVGTWEQISDIELDETEIFVTSTSSVTPDNQIGTISNQSKINTYYTSSDYLNKSLLGTASLSYNTSILNNSMRITGSGDVTIAQIKNIYAGSFVKDAEYKITLDAVGQKIGTAASMSIYLSGSAFNLDVTDKYNNSFPIQLGKRVGQLILNTNETTKRYDDQTFSFTANETGTGVLIFLIEGGYWYVSDIRTTSDNDTGYTPNYTRIRAAVPTAHKSDVQLDFKIEYYNSAGVKCKQENYVKAVAWEGGNRYIDGGYSMITGSLYIADSLESGIQLSGESGTGFIKSLGYNGFDSGDPGFLLYSGSAMPGTTTGGNPYSGTGLEMYANADNFFKYSTAGTGELNITTQTFYLGDVNNHISSTGGGIDIVGNSINLNTEIFTLGTATNYISGQYGGFPFPQHYLELSGSNVSIFSPNVFIGDSENGYLDTYDNDGNFKISGSSVVISSPTVTLGNIQEGFISIQPLGGGAGTEVHISGSKTRIESPKFFLGGNDNFISGSNGNIQISGSNIEIQTPNFLLGDYNNQFISGSNGLLEISSSKFHVSSSGTLYAKEGIFQDTNTADLFIYRNIVINTSNSGSVFTTFTDSGKTYYALNLTGSGDTALEGYGPATFIRVSAKLNYPIARINIHDLDKYHPTSGTRDFQKSGAFLVIESATPGLDPIYFTEVTVTDTYANYSDSEIAYDSDDIFAPGFTTYTINGTSYSDTIKLTSGTHALFAQSQFAWRIMSLSSTDGVKLQFASGLTTTEITGSKIQLTSLPTSNPGGTGIVWNDAGTLKIT